MSERMICLTIDNVKVEVPEGSSVLEDAKQAGIVAACLGFCLVAVFMFIYYWMTGLVADVALSFATVRYLLTPV